MNTVPMRFLAIALFALLISGCASVPMAPPEEDRLAKQFKPTPGMATIYLYRNESFGGAIAMDVFLDGKPMGQTGPETYFRWVVAPGKHTIRGSAENDSEVTLDTRAGGVYFVWQEVKLGFLMARNLLQVVDPQTGMAGVNESGLIAPLGGASAMPASSSGSGGSPDTSR